MASKVDALAQQAHKYMQMEDWLKAEKTLQKALELRPSHSISLGLLVQLYLDTGQQRQAVKPLTKLYDARRDDMQLAQTLASLLLETQDVLQSHKIYSRILQVQPDNMAALRGHAICSSSLGEPDKAIGAFKKLTQVQANVADHWSNLGTALMGVERYDQAIEAFEVSCGLDKHNVVAWLGLFNAYQVLGKFDLAKSCAQKAIEYLPDEPEILMMHTWFERYSWPLDKVLASFAKVAKHPALRSSAFESSGLVSKEQGDHDLAIQYFDRALKENPALHNAAYERGLSLLAMARFECAWRDYVLRETATARDARIFKPAKPRWDGKEFDGTLLVFGEMGIGEQILFSSLLPNFAGKSFKTIVAIQGKLVSLLQRSFPELTFVALEAGLDAHAYDFSYPLLDLGVLYRPTRQSFPVAANRYLVAQQRPSPQKDGPTGKPLVGVSWRSVNPIFGVDKSMAPQAIIDALGSHSCQLANLQYGCTKEQIDTLNQRYQTPILIDKGVDLFHDIEGLTCLIDQCDLIVTTSNSNAHIAAALGKSVILLASKGAGHPWYWAHENGRSIWYPSVLVLQQEKPGDWDSVLVKLRSHLENYFD